MLKQKDLCVHVCVRERGRLRETVLITPPFHVTWHRDSSRVSWEASC